MMLIARPPLISLLLLLFLFLSTLPLILADEYLVLDITSPPSLIGKYLGAPAAYGRSWTTEKNNNNNIYQIVKTEPPTACHHNTTISPSTLDHAHTLVLVARGNCSFVNKTYRIGNISTFYAGVILYNVATDSDAFTGPIVAGGSEDGIDEHSLLPTGMISYDLAQRILSESESESRTVPVPVMSHIHIYTRSSFDVVFIVMLIIAVGTVTFAALLSASKERYEMKQRMRGEPIHHVVHGDEIEAPVQTITQTAAIAFVFVASVGLLLMFFFIKKLIWVIIVVFCIAGIQGLTAILTLAAQAISPLKYRKNITIPAIGDVPLLGLICFPIAVTISVTWAVERNTSWAWGLQNLMSIALLLLIQRTVRLPNIKIASILLCLAFLYDIFWVFLSPYFFRGESVMVRVATGGDTGESIPMLIRLPRFNDELGGYSLLGLGDIALPGLLISYLCRHDYATNIHGFTLRGYFVISVIGYAIGMIITDGVLLAMQKGQPALLYLVPCTLGVIVVVAWYRGELSDLWNGTPHPHQQSQEGHTLLINQDANANDGDDGANIQQVREETY